MMPIREHETPLLIDHFVTWQAYRDNLYMPYTTTTTTHFRISYSVYVSIFDSDQENYGI